MSGNRIMARKSRKNDSEMVKDTSIYDGYNVGV